MKEKAEKLSIEDMLADLAENLRDAIRSLDLIDIQDDEELECPLRNASDLLKAAMSNIYPIFKALGYEKPKPMLLGYKDV